MLEAIVKRLSSSIEDKTQKVIPLAKQLTNADGKMWPAEYVGNGNYKDFSIDNFAGLSYFRLRSKAIISEVEQNGRPLNDLNSFLYPIRLVCAIQNSVVGKDDSFSPDALALTIVKQLNESNGNLKQDLSAQKATIRCESYDTDVKSILSEEYFGIERLKNSIPYNYSLVAIDINVDVIISNNCLANICKPYCNA